MSENRSSSAVAEKSVQRMKRTSPLLAVLVLAGCTQVVRGEAASPLNPPADTVPVEQSTESSEISTPTTSSLMPPTTSSAPVKVCKWSVSNPQPFETTNPQPGIILTPECNLNPTDPIKLYEGPDDATHIKVEFSPKGELAVGVHCVAAGVEVEGVSGSTETWVKAEVVAQGAVHVGYLPSPTVGYAGGPTDKVQEC